MADEQIVGCTDPIAINFNVTATLPCDNCCEYPIVSDIVGCIDVFAINYNSLATISCAGCCQYQQQSDNRKSLYQLQFLAGNPQSPFSPEDTPPTYPYELNPLGASCVRDSSVFDSDWVTNVLIEDNTPSNTYTYGTGYDSYILQLEATLNGVNPQTINGWPIASTENAFLVLLNNGYTQGFFINNTTLTPWIIPLYVGGQSVINPNQTTFISDCNTVGGDIWSYDTGKDNSFMTCLCSSSIPSPCQTIDFDGTVNTLTPNRAVCVKDGDIY